MRALLSATIAALAGLGALGCPGSLPEASPDAGGSMGGGGGGGGGSAACDATPILAAKCALAGCHNSQSMMGGLDLMTAPIATRLLGVTSTGANGSQCGGYSTPYLVPHQTPAMGLLLDKLKSTPPCGVISMALLAGLTPDDIACIESWATQVTAP